MLSSFLSSSSLVFPDLVNTAEDRWDIAEYYPVSWTRKSWMQKIQKM